MEQVCNVRPCRGGRRCHYQSWKFNICQPPISEYLKMTRVFSRSPAFLNSSMNSPTPWSSLEGSCVSPVTGQCVFITNCTVCVSPIPGERGVERRQVLPTGRCVWDPGQGDHL